MVSQPSPKPQPAPEPTWTTKPVYDSTGQRICALPDCTLVHKARGLCRIHWWRWKHNGDPYQVSRFATKEEKDAYVAADIESRRQRHAVIRAKREAEAETFRLLRTRSVSKIRPQATALVAALDELSEAERAAVADGIARLLLGQPVEDLIDRTTC